MNVIVFGAQNDPDLLLLLARVAAQKKINLIIAIDNIESEKSFEQALHDRLSSPKVGQGIPLSQFLKTEAYYPVSIGQPFPQVKKFNVSKQIRSFRGKNGMSHGHNIRNSRRP